MNNTNKNPPSYENGFSFGGEIWYPLDFGVRASN